MIKIKGVCSRKVNTLKGRGDNDTGGGGDTRG